MQKIRQTKRPRTNETSDRRAPRTSKQLARRAESVPSDASATAGDVAPDVEHRTDEPITEAVNELDASDAAQSAEMRALMHDMTQAYRLHIKNYRRYYGADTAEKREAEEFALQDVDRQTQDAMRLIGTLAPKDIAWRHLFLSAGVDMEASQAAWRRVCEAARDELESGNRAAKGCEQHATPYQRAQFLVVRKSFIAEWQPRGGIEQAMNRYDDASLFAVSVLVGSGADSRGGRRAKVKERR